MAWHPNSFNSWARRWAKRKRKKLLKAKWDRLRPKAGKAQEALAREIRSLI